MQAIKHIRTLVGNWTRESELMKDASETDPSEYADGYARGVGKCAVTLKELLDYLESDIAPMKGDQNER